MVPCVTIRLILWLDFLQVYGELERDDTIGCADEIRISWVKRGKVIEYFQVAYQVKFKP